MNTSSPSGHRRMIAACLLSLLLPLAVPLQAQTITTTTLDAGSGGGNAGQYTSMLVVNGNPAIAYYNVTERNLMFARNSAVDGTGSWLVTVVDTRGDVGIKVSLAIINGNPAISYHDSTNQDLKYVRATDVNGTAWGAPVALDTAINSGYYNSLAEINGRPAIAYFAFNGGELRYIRANDSNGTIWGAPVIVDDDGSNQTGGTPSLLVVNGRPAISYQYITFGDLRYVRANNADGTSWGAPVALDAAGPTTVGEFSSLAIVNGNPAVSYYDSTNSDLKYVRANDVNGATWAAPVIADSAGAVGFYTSLKVVNGNPAISYYDNTNLDLKFVRATDANGSGWSAPQTVASTGSVGAYTSLVIVNGVPAISYYDATNGDLKYVRSGDANGTGWHLPGTADAGAQSGNTGQFTSQSIINGNPAISYYDVNTGNLRYMRANDAAGTSWSAPITVVSTGDVGLYTSLTTVTGRPAIAYYDATNSVIKYIRSNDINGAGWGTPVSVAVQFGATHMTLLVVNGNPAFCYFGPNDDLDYIRANDVDGTSWPGVAVTLDSLGRVGEHNSMAIVNGNPAISYHGGSLKYVRATNASGTAWSAPVTVDSGSSGLFSSLVVVNGNPAISYFNDSNLNIKYVRATDTSGTAWGTPLNLDGGAGGHNSLAIINGKPAVSYWDEGNHGLQFVGANDASGTTWSAPVIVDNVPLSSENLGQYTSMVAIGSKAAIGYYDVLNGDLKWATLSFAAPDITLSQASALTDGVSAVSFGAVSVGNSSAPLTFTITNSGNASMTSLAVGTDGTNASDFSVDTSGMLTTLAAGNSTTFNVTFSPSATGARIAALHIASNVSGAKNPFDIILTGADAPAPEIAVEQPAGTELADNVSTVSYGDVLTGVPVVKTFTVKNIGDATLNLTTVTKDGTDAAEFTVSSLSSGTVAPGASATFSVTFTPSTLGAKTAAIHIGSDDADESAFDISLTGNGVTVDIAVEQPEGTNLTDGVSSIDYGSTVPGTTVTRTFTIKNTGTATLSLSGVLIDGTNADEFSIGSLSGSGVLPGGAATFDVTFTPSSVGPRTATIHVISDDADENPFDIALTGAGLLQEIAVEQPAGTDLADGVSSIAFGTTTMGTPVVKTFTVRNAGLATLTLSPVTKDGADAALFAVGSLSSTSLAPAATATFTVTFNPTTIGAKNAAIHIPSNDVDENPFDIALTGTGTGPEIAVEQPAGTDLTDGTSTVSYGSVVTGTPVVKTFAVRNFGDQNLTGLVVTKDGTNATEFIVSALSSSTVTPGGSATFDVTFTTFAVGTRTAAIHIASNDFDENPFDINLSASGIGPEIVVEQPSGTGLTDNSSTVVYGSVLIGAPVVKTFTIRNIGTDDLTGLVVTKDGTNAASFTVSVLGATTLTTGTSATFDVTFNPAATGAMTAAIHIASNDADENPFDIALTGTAVSPEIAVEQPSGTGLTDGVSTVACGSTAVGTPVVKTFTVRNSGSSTLNLTGVTKDGADAADFTVGSLSSTALAPLATATFNVTFNPAVFGAKNAAIHIGSDDLDENPFDISLTGTGTAPEIGVEQPAGTDLTDNVSSIAFGTTLMGTPVVKTLTVRNNGNATLTLSTITKDGTNSADFTVGTPGSSSLAPAATTTFTVTFNPSVIGAKTAAIHLPSNDADENPFDIVLNGTGTGPEIAVEQPAGTGLTDGSSTVAYGNVLVGTASVKTFTILNLGDQNLTGLAVTKDGTNPGDFTVGSLSSTTVTPGGSATFDVTFNTAVAAARSAAIHIANNDFNENPFDITVSGTGVAPEIAVEQPLATNLTDNVSVISFGSGLMGSTSTAKVFTIKNIGTGNLINLAITKDGAASAEYSVDTTGMTTTVAPGGSTTFSVTFSPTTPGARTAALHIANNDSDENPFDIALTGDGVMPSQVAQQAYVKASNTGSLDVFGAAAAISGDTVVVSSFREDSVATGIGGNQTDNTATDAGAVYVFVRSGTTWTQQAYLKASNTGAGDQFGNAVAISGDTIVVGANGEDSIATGINGNQTDNSALSAGAAYVFTRSGTTWTQQAYLKASNTGAGDQFGNAVAISGDTIIVGAYFEDSAATGVNGNQADNSVTDCGAAYVFTRSGTTWTQQAYLKGSSASLSDQFGISVGISGDTVVVGDYGDDSNATGINGNSADNSSADSGAAFVFVRSGTTWTQQAYLKPSNTGAGDLFGISSAIDGNTIVIGSIREDSNATGINGTQTDNSATDAGAAYVYTRSGAVWSQQAYLKPTNTGANDNFGYAVAVSGDTIVVGAKLEDSASTGVNGDQTSNAASDSGAAYVFVRGGGTWLQQAYLKASNTGATDGFGYAVGLAGGTVVVGAPTEDSVATGIGGNQADNTSTDSGAAYIFNGLGPGDIAVEQPVGTALVDGSGSSSVGGAPVGGSGTPVTFTISNTGVGTLMNLVVSKDGANASEFNVNTTGMSTTLVAGATTTFTVTFSPTAAGARTASLHIASNDVDENPFDILINGTGNVPEITVEQPVGTGLTDNVSSIGFGSVNAGSPGTPVVFTVSNIGLANLTGLAVTKDGANAADFTVNTTNLTSTIAPAASATFSVTFTPGALGARVAAIHIASNDTDENPFDIALTGTGADLVTQPPVLNAPVSNATTSNPVSIDFTLPEAASAGTVKLTFDDGVTPRVLTLASSQETAGNHTFTFVSSNPSGSAAIASGPALPDRSTYSVKLQYQDVPGNPAASSSAATGVIIDTAGPTGGTMTLNPTSPVDGGAALSVLFAGWTDPRTPLTYQVFVDNVSMNTPGTSATVNFTGPALAGSHSLKGSITDSLGNLTEVTQSFTVKSATQSWTELYFGTSGNTGNAADNFDFDGDGIPNLLEFAMHLNPTTASVVPTTTTINGATIEFVYSRSKAAMSDGILFAVEWSDTLSAANWSNAAVTETVLSDDGTVQQVKALVPAGSGGGRFVHLRVTRL